MEARGIAYLLDRLAEAITVSGKSKREMERELGVAHGWIGRFFRGEIELKVRHIEDFGRILGFSLEDFFCEAYRSEGTLAASRARLSQGAMAPRRLAEEETAATFSAAERREIQRLVQEELARRSLSRPPGES